MIAPRKKEAEDMRCDGISCKALFWTACMMLLLSFIIVKVAGCDLSKSQKNELKIQEIEARTVEMNIQIELLNQNFLGEY